MNYDRIILELLDRVSKLEEEVERFKEKEVELEEMDGEMASSGRDRTKYVLDGKIYGKNRLVHGIVRKYVDMNPDTDKEGLLRAFDKSLQGPLGVVRDYKEAKENCSDYTKRYFTKIAERISTTSGTMVVCSQWSVDNIGNVIMRAKEFGIEISVVET